MDSFFFLFLCVWRKRVEFFVISQWTSKNDHGNGSYKRRSQFYSFSEYKKVLIDYSNIINLSYQKTIYIYIFFFFFFSSMCHSRCCPSLVGQPSVPSSSSFLKIMMNKDFWGFLFYSNKLSVALNDMVLGRSLWIY